MPVTRRRCIVKVNHRMMGERVVGEFEAAINGQHCAIYGETLDYTLGILP